ncbi:MAG TPA: nicotinamide riboside transporter PnuC [Ferruginibacter sp.]|nr:nicotinamide riboside transporter PnuC [Ferruginibacter sp.]
MKFFSTLLLILVFQWGFASTYYISTKGDDRTGNGSTSNPWRTLYKATASVKTPGDIIHVTAGLYVETVRCMLAVGVSIEGEGTYSIIQSTLTEQFVAIIIATSPEGTDGNQHISHLKLDGNKRTTSWAIEIRGRKNVSIHDCTIADFEESGVFWGGRNDNDPSAPSIYATGNSFYNNILTNCAKYDGYGRGCLVIGGQQGMLVYNNTISQTGRAKGTNGWPIKYCNDGFLKGCKIYNNTITKEPYDGKTWDFAIELFNESGLEIYNNTIIGSIDLNYQTKGEYAYSVYIHDNIIGPTSLKPRVETGITLEFDTENAIIANNQLRNLTIPIYFTPRDGSVISDVLIKNNICEHIGVADGSHKGFAINFTSAGGDNHIISNFFVDSNKFIASTQYPPYYGIGILGASAASNIKIQNNTIRNFSVAAIVANPASVINGLLIEKNILSGNGNNNKPFFTRGTPANYTIRKNDISGPATGINIKQQIIRPFYYEVKSLTILEIIAAFAGILSLLFCRKENIYVFPMALLYSAIHLFLSFEQGYPGNGLVHGFFAILCIYGWLVWAKRDRRRHRITRITTSTKNEKLVQLALFAVTLIGGFFVLTYFEHLFSPGTIRWAAALAAAAGITGMWSMTRKRTEGWYWWIIAKSILIPLLFLKYQLFASSYHLLLLLMSVWGLYEWKTKRIIIRKN